MRLFRSETGKLCPAGQIWSTTWCMASKLRMVFTLLNDWGEINCDMKIIWNLNFSVHKVLLELKNKPAVWKVCFPNQCSQSGCLMLLLWLSAFGQFIVKFRFFNLLSGVKLKFDYLSKVMTNLDSYWKAETLLCQQRSI